MRRILSIGVAILCVTTPAWAIDMRELIAIVERNQVAIRSAVITRTRSETRLGAGISVPAAVLKVSPDFQVQLEVNRSRQGREQVIVDRGQKQWRLGRVDMRDLASLSETSGGRITPGRISWSVTLIAGDKDYYLTLHPDNSVLGITPVPGGGSPRLPITSGVIPLEIASGALSSTIEEVTYEGRQSVRVVLTTESCQTTYYLDPEIGYRLRVEEVRSTDGKLLRRQRLCDYRTVNGIPYPFLCINQSFDADGLLVMEDVIATEEVDLNQDIPPSTFALIVPEQTSVSLLAGPEKRVFVTDRELTLTLDTALEIWNLVARLGK